MDRRGPVRQAVNLAVGRLGRSSRLAARQRFDTRPDHP